MACLEMYNNNSTSSSQASPPMSPRISFSNDFVESSHNFNSSRSTISSSSSSQTPASSDFEFSVSNYNMMSADELFCKGRILPFSFKDNDNCGRRTRNNNNNNNTRMMQRTLRDQLLVDEEHHHLHDNIFSLKPPKSSSSSSSNGWKGFLGLRKSHIGSKKVEKIDPASFDSPKSSQDMVSNEGPSSNDMEMGI